MARIRNVKPEFLIDPELQDLEVANPGAYVMLVYEGLWCQSSKNGVFWYEPRVLKLGILPFIQYEIEKTLNILYEKGYIKHFQIEGKKYGFVVKFHKHQTISGQEKTQSAKYPDYVEGSDWEVISDCPIPIEGSEREGRGKADLGLRTLDLGLRTQDMETPPAAQAPKAKKDIAIPDPLYNKIKAAFEKVSGDFTNYAKEGAAIKRIIKLTEGDEVAIEGMVKTFYSLTRSTNKFWSEQPFTPSVLSSGSIWDRVKLAAQKKNQATDTSWIQEFEEQDKAVNV